VSRFEEALASTRVVAIMRGLGPENTIRVARALRAGGIRCIEVTYPSPGSLDSVQAIVKELPDMVCGMGTVLTPEEVDRSVEAGAEFIVAPNTDPAVIKRARELGKDVAPGAMTPTEAWNAVQAGATLVKIFPASAVTPSFFREMRGPFPQIRLMATGGVSADTAAEFISKGAYAVGMGGFLVSKDLIAAGDFAQIEANARSLIASIQKVLA